MDGNGFYEFTDLEAGDYTVYEDLTNVTGWYAVWLHVLGIHETITINSGDKIQKDFVNFQGVNISGSKFNDLNGNGEWDSGEPAFPTGYPAPQRRGWIRSRGFCHHGCER